MNFKIRKLLLVCSCSPLLMSVLCEKVDTYDNAPLLVAKTKVTLSDNAIFTKRDTLWITGTVSSMLYDTGTQDSVKNDNEAVNDIISVLQLKSEDKTSNTTEAISSFKLVTSVGGIDFLGACPDSELIAIAPLSQDGQSYRYKIGLVAEATGDFLLDWLYPVNLTVNDLNTKILENYPIDGNTNTLGLTKCGITSTIPDVINSGNQFFFSVE